MYFLGYFSFLCAFYFYICLSSPMFEREYVFTTPSDSGCWGYGEFCSCPSGTVRGDGMGHWRGGVRLLPGHRKGHRFWGKSSGWWPHSLQLFFISEVRLLTRWDVSLWWIAMLYWRSQGCPCIFTPFPVVPHRLMSGWPPGGWFSLGSVGWSTISPRKNSRGCGEFRLLGCWWR